MELIKELGRKFIYGGNRDIGLFACEVCGNNSVKTIYLGKRLKSCGCLRRIEKGVSWRKTRLYSVWTKIKERCLNKRSISYKNYGERGIGICDEWKCFVKFKDWALNNGYCDDLQIDRIDNDGDYKPENCQFVINAYNCRKRRTSKMNWPKVNLLRTMYKSGTYTQKRLGEIFGISHSMVWQIVSNKQWKV